MYKQFRETGELTDRIREELRCYRIAHRFSRYALGRMLGVEAITISRWERGETKIVQLSQRCMIADLLEGRLEGRGVCHEFSEVVPNPDLSKILWSICEIYARCKMPEKRRELFIMLDELEMELRKAQEKTQ